MSVKVFIDGSSGTTGLRIADRLAARPEIELLSISAEGRKDVNERASVINSANLAFLCLPDAASKEVMPLLRPDVKVLDTSTAFRTDPAWDYGFPELKGQKEKIKNSYRVAVPGCYASGFISIARPLVELGLLEKASFGSPYIMLFVCIAVIAGFTGSATGGLAFVLDNFTDKLVAMGGNPEALTRIANISQITFDSLPHNSAIVLTLSYCGVTHKEGYKHLFVVTVVTTTLATIVNIIMAHLGVI